MKNDTYKLSFSAEFYYKHKKTAMKHFKTLGLVYDKAIKDSNGFINNNPPHFINSKGADMIYLTNNEITKELDRLKKLGIIKKHRCVMGNLGRCIICERK